MALIETRSFGCGVGLRSPHYPVVTDQWPEMDWFEAISENYMDTGGRPFHILEKVRQHYPVALHGTALSLGSSDDLNPKYLERLKRLVEAIEPFIVSDHLCWSGIGGDHLHDLLPLPFTEEALRHVSARIMQAQEFLGRRILIENVSAYVTFKHSTMTEWEFLNGVAERADCGILLDVNNIYVNSVNHGFDPKDYVRAVAGERVLQMHVAGHTDMGTYLFDTHSKAIIDPVWDLYEQAIKQWGPISTLIEWDEDIPDWERLSEEAAKARKIYAQHVDQKIDTVSGGSKSAPRRAASSQKLSAVSLTEIQETLRELIEKPEDASAARERLDAVLNPQGGVSGGERAGVYAGGLPARFHESLTEVYDAVLRILGPEEFAEMAHAYTYRYPSRDYNLNHAGRQLPEFILDSPKISEFPFLAELAQLEWHIWEAFHAFDGPALDPASLAGISEDAWDGARLYFQPSLRLMKSEWNVLELWLARRSPEAPSPEARKDAARILIGRRQDQIRCEILDPAQYFLMDGLLKGEPLGRVCEDLAALQISEEPPVSDWFARWIQDGLIQRCEFLPKKSAANPRAGRRQKAKA